RTRPARRFVSRLHLPEGGGDAPHPRPAVPTPSPTPTPNSSGTSVLTYHNDNGRTAQNVSETVLTPANVASSTFGKIRFDSVDGKVDAEPLYASSVAIPGKNTHNVLIVVSEHDTVYAFDADTGATLWTDTM